MCFYTSVFSHSVQSPKTNKQPALKLAKLRSHKRINRNQMVKRMNYSQHKVTTFTTTYQIIYKFKDNGK